LQAVAAIKLLTGQAESASEALFTMDLWAGRFRSTLLADAKRPDCLTCGQRRFEFLDRPAGRSVSLCGRNAVQVRPAISPAAFDLDRVAAKLRTFGPVEKGPYLVRCELQGLRLTVFGDGRAIIQGTTNAEQARSLYARAIGS
jgi:adenylyltransferase/sulfurtransferase